MNNIHLVMKFYLDIFNIMKRKYNLIHSIIPLIFNVIIIEMFVKRTIIFVIQLKNLHIY